MSIMVDCTLLFLYHWQPNHWEDSSGQPQSGTQNYKKIVEKKVHRAREKDIIHHMKTKLELIFLTVTIPF